MLPPHPCARALTPQNHLSFHPHVGKGSLGSVTGARGVGQAGSREGLVVQNSRRGPLLGLLLSSVGCRGWAEPKILRNPGIPGAKGRLPSAKPRRTDRLRGHVLLAGALPGLPAHPSVLCAREVTASLNILLRPGTGMGLRQRAVGDSSKERQGSSIP